MALLNLSGFTGFHDPVIVKEKDTYYCFSTHGIASTSKDLCSWGNPYRVYEKNLPWVKKMIPSNNDDMWAPEVVFRHGVWRMYYSVSTFGKNISLIGLMENKTLDPASQDYKWEDKGLVVSSCEKDNFNAIDPAVCKDENGKDYLIFGSFWKGIMLLALDENGLPLKEEKPLCIASRGNGGKNPLRDENPIEGAFIFKRGEYYYLFASHDFCCRGTASTYHIVLGVSKDIKGPYLDASGYEMLCGGGTTLRDGSSFTRWAGPGHNTVFHDTDGKDYLIYHAYDRTKNGENSLMIEPVIWKDDWPCFD